MRFAAKHYKNRHLEQLSRTSWPAHPENIKLKTACAKIVFQGQVRKHYVCSGFLPAFLKLRRKCFFWRNQLASLKRTIFEEAAAKSYRNILSGKPPCERKSVDERGPFRKRFVLQAFQERHF